MVSKHKTEKIQFDFFSVEIQYQINGFKEIKRTPNSKCKQQMTTKN